MTFLCQYRHIFGKEKEGLHSYRFMDIAIVDVLLTFIGALLIAYWFKVNIILFFYIFNNIRNTNTLYILCGNYNNKNVFMNLVF